MELLIELLWIACPFLLVMFLLYKLAARKNVIWKIVIIIGCFVVIRTLLFYEQVWWIQDEHGKLLIDFTSDTWLLITLSLIGILIVVGCFLFQMKLNLYVKWASDSVIKSIIFGLISSIFLISPMLLWNFYTLWPLRTVESASLLVSVAAFIIIDKFIEELVFRGYLQGYLDRFYSPLKSNILTTSVYSLSHLLILIIMGQHFLFVFVYSIFAGFIFSGLRNRYGIVSSALANGVSILGWYFFI